MQFIKLWWCVDLTDLVHTHLRLTWRQVVVQRTTAESSTRDKNESKEGYGDMGCLHCTVTSRSYTSVCWPPFRGQKCIAVIERKFKGGNRITLHEPK